MSSPEQDQRRAAPAATLPTIRPETSRDVVVEIASAPLPDRRLFIGMAATAGIAATLILGSQWEEIFGGPTQKERQEYFASLKEKLVKVLEPSNLEETRAIYIENINAEISQLSDKEKAEILKLLEQPTPKPLIMLEQSNPDNYQAPIKKLADWLTSKDTRDFGNKEDNILGIIYQLKPETADELAITLGIPQLQAARLGSINRYKYTDLLTLKVSYLLSANELDSADSIHYSSLAKELPLLSREELDGVRSYLVKPLPGSEKTALNSVINWLSHKENFGEREGHVMSALDNLGFKTTGPRGLIPAKKAAGAN